MADWKLHLEQALAPGDASVSGLDAEARATALDILAEASASKETEALLHLLDESHPHRDQQKHILPKPAYLRGQTLLELERPAEALELWRQWRGCPEARNWDADRARKWWAAHGQDIRAQSTLESAAPSADSSLSVDWERRPLAAERG